MDRISQLYKKRNLESMKLIKDAFNFRVSKDTPFIFNTANYFSFGYATDEIPDDYYTDPKVMMEKQIAQFEHHYEIIEDNFVPYLMPWYGTGVTASAFGVPVKFIPKMDPTTEFGIIQEPSDIEKMQVPDPEKDGLMPKVLETIRYFMANSDIPINFTDNHGPLTLAVQVVGYEKLFYWMMDYPKLIHKLMDLFADTVIMWVTAQKKLMGHQLNYCVGNQGIPVPDDVGVWFSDDDAVIISADLYREFVVPYNEKILKHFGGGIVHYCGNGNQHIESFKSQKYLRGINNFALGEWWNVLKIKEALEDRVTYIACDFTHHDYFGYYQKLFDEHSMSKRGLVVQSLFSPLIGAKDGKYELINRDDRVVAQDMTRIIQQYFRG